jgi:hypothetical protein
MTTLTNSFHGTSIRIRISTTWEQIEAAAYRAHGIAPYRRTKAERTAVRRMQRIKEALCGMHDCKCGTVR